MGVKLFDPLHCAYVWGGPKEVFFPNPNHAGYALTPQNRLVANEQLHTFPVIPHLLEVPITWEFRTTLEQVLGYKENRDLFFLSYDWRQDYRCMADPLEHEIEKIQMFFGKQQQIILIAQSMSNLGIRYFLRHTNATLRKTIAKWYCFGPPWEGSYNALKLLEEGFYPATKRFRGFNFHDIFTYPACFQLLPQNAKLMTSEGQPIEDFDIYNSEHWWKYNLANIQNQGLDPDWRIPLSQNLLDAKKFASEIQGISSFEQEIPQVWFVSDRNHATITAIFDQKKVISDPEQIKKYYPILAPCVLETGDEHIPLSHLIRNPCGPVVRDYTKVPYGENYILIGKPVDHRALINYYRPNLEVLVQDIASIKERK